MAESPIGDIEADLERIRRTPPEVILREMTWFRRLHHAGAVVRPWLEDPSGMAVRLADTLEAYCITAGGASQHLGALRGAGLVSGRRDGRSVLYVRTPLGDGIVAGEGS